MKKIISVALSIVMIGSVLCALNLTAYAADKDILTVTDEGRVLAEVEVGNEFIYRVGLNTAGFTIYGGQGSVSYDSDYAQIVEYGVDSRGNPSMDFYTFPEKIRNSSLVCNYFEWKNLIKYNYAKYRGIDAFDDVNEHYFKIRFKAVKAGTVEITHTMEQLSHMSNRLIRLFTDGKVNTQLDPMPYTFSSAEPSSAYIGDADGDYNLTVLDATFIQYATAGLPCDYNITNADVNSDGDINLKDAVQILRYKAGMTAESRIGEWIFDSEL